MNFISPVFWPTVSVTEVSRWFRGSFVEVGGVGPASALHNFCNGAQVGHKPFSDVATSDEAKRGGDFLYLFIFFVYILPVS